MGLYDDASLIFLPSAGAGKDTKAYSVKPTDGKGDFTFSRGSNLTATRVGPTGLIEKSRVNWLLYSNSFDQWTLDGSPTITGGQEGYDGTNDAWKIYATANANGIRGSVPMASDEVYAFSIYAKAGTANFLFLEFRTGVNVDNVNRIFDLQNGTSNAWDYGAPGIPVDVGMEDVGNGWWRIYIVVEGYMLSSDSIQIYGIVDNQFLNPTTNTYLYLQDAQFESGLVVTDYIETQATEVVAGLGENEPRFDYSDASCPSLLLEPQRTNHAWFSEHFTYRSWINENNLIRFENVSKDTLSPDGYYNSTKLIKDGGGNPTLKSDSVITPGNQYVFSIYAKAGTSNYLRISIGDTDETIITLTNEWKRYKVSTASSSADFVDIRLGDSASVGDYVYIWGAQIEDGSYETSYIPNHYNWTVTRTVDNCENTNLSLLSQTSATYFFDITPNGLSSLNISDIRGNGSTNDRILLQTGNNGALRVVVRANSVSVVDSNISGVFNIGQRTKIALKYTPTNVSVFIDGQPKLNSNVSVSFLNPIDWINLEGTATNNVESMNLNQFLFFPTDLSESDCISLTTP